MIFNLRIKLIKENKTQKVIFKIIIKTTNTLSYGTDYSICDCNKAYPKVIDLGDSEYLVPIEGKYTADYTAEVEGDTPEEVSEKAIDNLSHTTGIERGKFEHGIWQGIQASWQYGKCCKNTQPDVPARR